MVKKWKYVLTILILITSFFIFRQKFSDSKINFLPAKKTGHIILTENRAKIGLMGDLGLGRIITATARSKKDFNWSFSGVSDWLQQNDINLANLESPIINNCPTANNDTFVFCGDPKFIPSLKINKFILCLDNNHILNYGQNGLIETKKYLNENEISYAYNSEFTKKVINNISFGFLSYDLVSAHQINKEDIINSVKKYDSQVDWLIISLHWGNEYLTTPENWRIGFAHQLIDRGADIIHGHHPHVLQPMETYKGKLIFYSLGNFIFDQNWSVPTSTSEMIRLTLSKNKVENIEKTPIIIKYNSRPEIVPPILLPASSQ